MITPRKTAPAASAAPAAVNVTRPPTLASARGVLRTGTGCKVPRCRAREAMVGMAPGALLPVHPGPALRERGIDRIGILRRRQRPDPVAHALRPGVAVALNVSAHPRGMDRVVLGQHNRGGLPSHDRKHARLNDLRCGGLGPGHSPGPNPSRIARYSVLSRRCIPRLSLRVSSVGSLISNTRCNKTWHS